MEFLDFVNIVTELKEKKPTLFGLCGDNISTYEKIEEAERYFGIKFPESYKDFLKKYGGGYFAYTVVYSCDPGSGFYLVDNVSKEWVYENDFFPVIDFETGDLGGFRITDHSCD